MKAAVKRVLRKRGVKQEDFDGLTDAVLGQAVGDVERLAQGGVRNMCLAPAAPRFTPAIR